MNLTLRPSTPLGMTLRPQCDGELVGLILVEHYSFGF